MDPSPKENGSRKYSLSGYYYLGLFLRKLLLIAMTMGDGWLIDENFPGLVRDYAADPAD